MPMTTSTNVNANTAHESLFTAFLHTLSMETATNAALGARDGSL
jgi:type II secretory pathway component PulK